MRRSARVKTPSRALVGFQTAAGFGEAGEIAEPEEKRRFPCSDCDFVAKHLSALVNHKNIKHEGMKPYKCDVCDQAFASSQTLREHSYIHTAEKPLKCEKCDKSFRQVSALSRHMKTHVGEITLQCNQCDELVSGQVNLKNHMKTHLHQGSDVSSINQLQCDFCDKQFASKGNLTRHERRHLYGSEYQCIHCSRRFTRNYALEDHLDNCRSRLPDQ